MNLILQKVHITDCGEFRAGENWGLEENDCTADKYPPWPEDWDYADSKSIDVKEFKAKFTVCYPIKNISISFAFALQKKFIVDVVKEIKDSGNHYYAKKDFINAGRKYKKALRYHEWLNEIGDLPNELEGNVMNLKMVSWLNLAAVHLKNNRPREAVKLCNQVCILIPHSC